MTALVTVDEKRRDAFAGRYSIVLVVLLMAGNSKFWSDVTLL